MDFANRAWGQLSDLFRSMTPAARITTAALLAAIVCSMAFLFRFESHSTDSFLFAGRVLSDREIARLEAAFAKAGLNEWEVIGGKIRVPRSQRFTYIAAAADANSLPDNFDSVIEATIKSSSAFETREQRAMKETYALQRELAQIIEALDGVEQATVKYTEERAGSFSRQVKKSALVAARSETNDLLTSQQVESIRRIVSSAINTPPENVTVQDLGGPSYPGRSSDGLPTAGDNLYASHKMRFEQQYREKIANAFPMIPGFIVAVNVELDPRLNHSSDMQTYSQPQPVRTTNSTTKSTRRSDVPGGRPGAVPNGALGNRAEEVAVTASGSESTHSETHEESVAVIGQETVRVIEAGLTPKTVTATIQIPKSYFRKIWDEQFTLAGNAPPAEPDPADLQRIEDEEIKRIETAVQNLIPRVGPGQDPYPRVQVLSYVDTPHPDPPKPSLVMTGTEWLKDNWSTLAMVALALVALFVVRSTLRSSQTETAATPPVPALTLSADEDEEGAEAEDTDEPAVASIKRRVKTTGPNLRDELTDLVREDPDAAAAILSSWIGDAA